MNGKISLFLGSFPAAPLFMLIMGWYAFRSKPLKTEIWRAIKLLCTGLLLNIALNANLFIHTVQGSIQVDRLAYLFGVDILFLAGLSLLTVAFLKRLLHDKWWALLLVAIAIVTITPFVGNDIPASGVWRYLRPFIADNFAWWSYFPLFPWLGYVLAGMAAAAVSIQNPQIWNYTEKLAFKTAIIIIFLAGAWYGWQISTNLQRYYHHNLLYFGWALAAIGASVYCWQYLIKTLPGISSLSWVGRNVTTIYIVQWIIIGNLSTWIYRTQSGAALILWFMVITLITMAVVNLINKPRNQQEEII
ncbi:MAG: hypothetical protein CVU06_16560 [Bacteroidetes bacterium HGW-Bacteroidetes-22]|nr:MAG: hypothetical protein CVU06_16560 [Bacteroidetes bacterium HGW-Bacteroidetes-22]